VEKRDTRLLTLWQCDEGNYDKDNVQCRPRLKRCMIVVRRRRRRRRRR